MLIFYLNKKGLLMATGMRNRLTIGIAHARSIKPSEVNIGYAPEAIMELQSIANNGQQIEQCKYEGGLFQASTKITQ